MIISYTSRHPEYFCQVIRYAIWSETLPRLGLITKSKKPLPGFCLSGSFHCDPIHRKSSLQVRPIRITNPRLRGQANLLFFFPEVPCQTLTFSPHTDLHSFSSPIPFLPLFTVNFLTFLLIQITEVIYMLTALSCFSSSHFPSLFSSFSFSIDKGLTSPWLPPFL